jgi:predicted esterase
LVLHGYSDSSAAARKRLLGADPVAGVTVLSPNGLFPAPAQKDGRFKEAYAWYFYDVSSGRAMISPELAASALLGLIKQIGLDRLAWTVLGFSQGGFFAPFLARAGLRMEAIVGVGAAYRAEAYQGLPPLAVYALHGELDAIVPFADARESFRAIQAMGYGKRFCALPGVAHSLDDAGRALARAILAEIAATGLAEKSGPGGSMAAKE